MKKILVFTLMVIFLASCNKPVKDEYKITGTVDTTFDGWVYLQQRSEGVLSTLDSSKLTNGKFQFTGTIEFPQVDYITIHETKSMVPFFIEPSDITININTHNIDKSKIEGSKSQKEYDGFLDAMDQFDFKVRENYQMYKKAEELGDKAKMHEYDSLIDDFYKQRTDFIKKFALERNASPVSPYIVLRNSYDYDLVDLDKVVSNFDTTLNKSIYMPMLKDYLKTLKRTAVGQLYVAFNMQDTTGLYTALTNFIGDGYLLVDFWASWCAPCRAENPNLVKTYNEFHDRGFDILGVSLDTDKGRWEKAINDDKLTWHHVSDLAGWDNKAAKLYGVRSIPANVLLDKQGYIIAKNLRGEDLRKKLEQLLNTDSNI
jgi:peroxiredoxin